MCLAHVERRFVSSDTVLYQFAHVKYSWNIIYQFIPKAITDVIIIIININNILITIRNLYLALTSILTLNPLEILLCYRKSRTLD